MKILVIAEKPSVGRDIARVLQCTRKGDGYLYSDTHIVSWAIGHLVTLCEPEDYDPVYKKWARQCLPILPGEIKLKPIQKTRAQLAILKKLMNSKEVGSIICATDSGREGELIFRYIYHIVNCKKSFQRLWVSSMTDTAVKEGFRNLRDGCDYDNLYLSAKCRSESDWLVGINATRAYTVQYGTLLSVGRVQTPTLSIIVRRQDEIDVFVPRDYWEVKGTFEKLGGTQERFAGTWFGAEGVRDSQIFEKEKACAIAEAVKGKDGVVESVENEQKRQPPGLLYDLTELQRDCNKRFGFSAQKTLSIAQDLYEKRKLITYPRTDSRYLTSDMAAPGANKIRDTLEKLCAPYAEYAEPVMRLPKLPLTKRIVDDSKVKDHHAIIPTDIKANLAALHQDERQVYDLVARKFVAAFYPPYIYNVTSIITNVGDEKFLTRGNTIVQWGYMELYKQDKKEGNEEDAPLPAGQKGDGVTAVDAEPIQKKTRPPKAYTEGSLLSAMENAGRFVEDEAPKEKLKESGLGTPATRAAIIERLIQVGYIVRSGKALCPTEKGRKLVQIIPEELKSPETTGKWEKALTSISLGKMDTGRFMGSIERYVRYIVEASAKPRGDIRFPREREGGKTK